MDYHPVLKRREILTHATTGINRDDICCVNLARHKRTNTTRFHFDDVARGIKSRDRK